MFGSEKADHVFIGKIYTGERSNPFANAFAIHNGQIIYVGDAENVNPHIDIHTHIHHVDSGCIVPGITEGHAHVTLTTDLLFGVQLYGIRSLEKYLQAISDYLKRNPNLSLLSGKGYITSVFGESGPTAALLDEISTTIPIIMTAEDCHSVWVNTKVLQLLHIDENTLDVPNGKIVRYATTQKPTGWFKEAATDLMLPLQPVYSVDAYKQAILAYQDMALSNGITICFEPFLASGKDFETRLEAYHQLELEKKLLITFRTALSIYPEDSFDEFWETALRLREKYKADEHMKLTTIKIYVDGVLENHTAYLLEPYADQPGDYGTPIWSQDMLNKIVLTAMQNNFQLHAHAIGDGAIEQILNAYENGDNMLYKDFSAPFDIPKKAITHLQIMKKEQKLRMAKNGYVAVVNPYWHFKDTLYFDALEIPYLGVKRAESEYPLASLIEAGVHVSQASDWPVTVPAKTFESLHFMVNRSEPGYRNSDPLKPEECLSVEEALQVLTLEGAYQLELNQKKGTISVDKDADFVIIDNDVLTMEPQRIYTTRVLSTYVHGQKVWSSIQ